MYVSLFFWNIRTRRDYDRSVNVTLGPKEDRLLMTGLHTVADIFCSHCQTVLGWKYVSEMLGYQPCYQALFAATVLNGMCLTQEMAFETSQKYKEGKFIIEKARLMKVGY